MRRMLLLGILITFIMGCASQANLEFSLETWVGHNVNGLVQHWGAPTKVDNSSSGTASYTWLFDNGISNSPIDGAVNAVAIYCKVRVDVTNDDTIQAWQIEGNDCKA